MTNLPSLILPNKSISYAYLKEEQKMCVEFANEMRMLTLAGKLPYVWFHIPNEFLPSARINYSFELKLKHMGKIAGVPDYCFLSEKEGFFIEFKRESGKQTDNQKVFHEWCVMNKVGYYICYSAQEGIKVVQGRLKCIS